MNDFLLSAMLCIGAIVVAALVGLVILIRRPRRAQSHEAQSGSSAGAASRTPRSNWISWLPYFGIALLLAIWSIWVGLFFLVVVALMRQNPGPETSFKVSENEKQTARRVYNLLFWSPLITVPVFLISLFSSDDVSTALLPLIFHLPLLAGLTSKSRFVYRHTQQGILLMALRAGSASLAITLLDDAGITIYLLGNGGLWLLGSLLGADQVRRGECWLMRRKGEAIQLVTKDENLAPHVHLEKSREFIQNFKKEQAKTHALAAFRKGNRDERLQALWALDVLEEVEKF